MARKQKADAEPDTVAAAPPKPTPTNVVDVKVADMPIRDLLQMLGRTLPESAPLLPSPPPPLPEGMDADAKVADLTAGDLLRLLAAFRG